MGLSRGDVVRCEERRSAPPPWNPFLDDWRALHGEDAAYSAWGREMSSSVGAFGTRSAHRAVLLAKYAFAVPGEEALEAIGARGPVVEMGAGLGYWARCLRERGVDVVAYDEMGPAWQRWFQPVHLKETAGYPAPVLEERPSALWTDVRRGGPKALADHGDRTLLLCWPYMDDMAAESMRHYPGNCVAYVGEPEGGCTANEEFWRLLADDWSKEESVMIPQWDGLHDALTVYRRTQ